MPDILEIPIAQLPPESVSHFKLGNRHIAVIHAGGEFFALDDACTHAGAPLSEGRLEGFNLICPWHHAIFDVRTGQVVDGPTDSPCRQYSVSVTNNTITITRNEGPES